MVDFDIQSFDLKPYQGSDELALHVKSLQLLSASDSLEIVLPSGGLRVASKSEELPLFESLEDHPLDHWSAIKLEIQVNSDSSSLGVYIQATCEKTRYERVWGPDSASSGVWPLEIPTGSVRDILALRAVSVAAPPSPTGLIDADSPYLLLRVDRPSIVLGGGVRAEWSDEKFVSRKGLLTFVDFSDPGEPVVYLNDRIVDFRTLMRSHKRGIVGALRTFLLSHIEADIWLSLGSQAAAHLVAEINNAGFLLVDEDLSDEDVVELPSGVVVDCLRTLSGLCSGRTDPNPILSITRRLMDGNQHEDIRAHVAARKKGGAHSAALNSLIQAVGSSTRN